MDNPKKTESLIDRLSDSLEPQTRGSRPAVRILLWLGAALLYFAFIGGIYGLRPDLTDKLTQPFYCLHLILSITLALSATAATLWLSFPDIRQQRWVAMLPLLPLTGLGILVTYHFLAALPDHSIQWAEMLGHMQCAVELVVFSILPCVTLFLIIRRAATTHTALTGGMAMMTAASFAYTTLLLVEMNDDIIHLFLWHFLPLLAISLIGLWLGRINLRW